MKDIVNYETAVRMKKAGFPQPSPEPGQIWYDPDFGPFFVGRRSYIDGRDRNIFYPETGKAFDKPEADFTAYAFAPTATDILRGLIFHHLRPLMGHRWAIHNYYELGDSVEISTNENPAEAAAEAWLNMNEPLEAKIKRASETWKDTNADQFLKEIRE